MTDTPHHIRELQNKTLAFQNSGRKAPQFLAEKEASWQAIADAKATMKLQKGKKNTEEN